MAGSTFGNIFRVMTWGESHGAGLGVVVDGCPAGIPLSEQDIQVMLDRRRPGQSKFTTPRNEADTVQILSGGVVVDGCPAGIPLSEQDIQVMLDRRRPGQSKFTTPRNEADTVQILSGVFDGKTTGTPISMVVLNKTQRSSDYSEIAGYYRPGHADYTFDEKYGFRDYRGGGRSSGRETIGRVAAGAIALKILEYLGIKVNAYAKEIGGISIDYNNFDLSESGRETIGRVAAGAIALKILEYLGIKVNAYAKEIGGISIDYNNFDLSESANNPFNMPDKEAAEKVEAYAAKKLSEGDSVGGIVECVISNMFAGIGEPVFDKLDANLAKAVMSIGAVKGFEIGSGFESAKMTGSENNDAFIIRDGKIDKETNNAGGILGGMSDGSDIVFRAAFKPTPSISKKQQTVNKDGDEISGQGNYRSRGGRSNSLKNP